MEEIKTEAGFSLRQKESDLDFDYSERYAQIKTECVKELRSEKEAHMLKCAKDKIEKEVRSELTGRLRPQIEKEIREELVCELKEKCAVEGRRELQIYNVCI